jgi:hypothetical protein
MSRVVKQLDKFNGLMGKSLLNEVKKAHPAKQIRDKVGLRLAQRTSTSSKRVRSILTHMKKNTRYTSTKSGNGKMIKGINGLKMNTIDISIMDKETNIKRLDQKHPQPHDAPFPASSSELKRNLRPAAIEYRKGFSLWRLFELPSSKSYNIPKASSGRMRFTSSLNGYSGFILARSVSWKAGSGRGVASSAYYMLNSSREVYKGDQWIFANAVSRGITKIIQRTGFKKT